MRRLTILLAGALLLIAAAPVPAPVQTPESPAAAVDELQRALADPGTEQTMTATAQALTDALLNLPVGEVEAALDGRTASAADKHVTVRDMARRHDPQFEANLRRQVAESGPAIRRGMQSLSAALPALVRSFKDAGAAIERATANLPDPSYPRR